MGNRRRDSLLVQGGILAAAGLLTKLIGFLYRIPMANMLGEQGNGIYSVAFGIYNIALTLSSYSLPAAVAKLISERLGRKRPGEARRVFRLAAAFAVAAGAAAFILLFFGADILEQVYHRTGLARPLRVLAPTAFVVAVLGVLRGWFQGHGNMVPTAVSQILEQVVNVAVSLYASWQLLQTFAGTAGAASYGAAGGTLGTLAGAAAALLFVLALFWRSNAHPHLSAAEEGRHERKRSILQALIATIIPLILSQTIYQLGSTVDDFLFGSIMAARGVTEQTTGALLGVYNTQYNQMTTLPVAITTAMAASLLPGIALLLAQRKKADAMRKIRAVIKLNMVIAIPAAVGLAVLAGPILSVLYPRLTQYHTVSVRLLQLGSVSVVLYALSTLTAAVLQGSNHMHTPVRNAAISLGVHAALVYCLLWYTDLGIYALLIGNVTFPLLLAALNCRAIERKLYFAWEYRRTFLLPFLASIPMALVAVGMDRGMDFLGQELPSRVTLAVLAAAVVYAISLLRLGCFSRQELAALPLSRFWLWLAGNGREP